MKVMMISKPGGRSFRNGIEVGLMNTVGDNEVGKDRYQKYEQNNESTKSPQWFLPNQSPEKIRHG